MKIAILDDYQDAVRQLDCFQLLDGHEVKVFNNTARGVGQLAARLAPFDALVLIRERTVISKALLDKLPNLKLISQTGKISGHVDVDAATARGVAIVEGVGDPTAPAELTWALIMDASRRVSHYAAYLKQGLWQAASPLPQHNRLGMALKGRTLGIWGYGKIGRKIAAYGKAFGMEVLVWGREPGRQAAQQDGYAAADSKESFFARSDVLTLHLRLNEATRGIVQAADLAAMKPTAILVNTSRAELVPRACWKRRCWQAVRARRRSTCSSRSRCRLTMHCCAWITCWRRRTWATWKRMVMSCISALLSAISWILRMARRRTC